MTSPPFHKLKQRFTMSLIGLFILITLTLLSHHFWARLLFTSTLAFTSAAAMWEYYEIARVRGYLPLNAIGIGGGILYTIAVYLTLHSPHALFLPLLILATTLLCSFMVLFCRQDQQPMGNLAITFFAIAYIAIPLSAALGINFASSTHDGRWWLLYVLAVSKLTDTAAYFSGKLFGKHPLAATISPKKTTEGAIGGMIGALGASLLYSILLPDHLFSLSLMHSIYLGLAIGLLAQIGDLAESLLKRDAGVKDSNVLPGLGGMLDIVDSVIFTLPFLYFYLHIQTTFY